jgi:ABC-2 type transport system permease protein
MNLTRVFAIIVRHLYLYQRSLPRLIEIFYWPTLDLLLWGFVALYLSNIPVEAARVASLLVGALILYDVFLRSTLGVSVTFLEEPWTRNLVNLFVSPLTTLEYLAGIIAVSLIKTTAAVVAMALLGWLLYAFNILTIGPALVPFIIALLLFGWASGIFATAIILRYGLSAEILAWGLAFLIQPLSAVYYPVTVLPPALQYIAYALPTTYIFEGMRLVRDTGEIPIQHLFWAFGLDAIYLALALVFFGWIFTLARRKGLLMQME